MPPGVFRQVEELTRGIIAQRHAGSDDMVGFNRECTKALVRDNMSGSGAARTAVGVMPPSSVGGFTFSTSAAVSVRDTDLSKSYEDHVSQSELLPTGLPVIGPSISVAGVFDFMEGLVEALSKVRPTGALFAGILAQCMELDRVPHVCALVIQPKGPGAASTWLEATELLEQAYVRG